MEQDDYVMRDTAMPSTEPNGIHRTSTVNPSMISLNGRARVEQLPIHNHREPMKPNSTRNLPASLQKPPFRGGHVVESRSRQSSPEYVSDDMDMGSSVSSLVEVRIPPRPKFSPLPYPSARTGLVYDSRMRLHVEPTTMAIREDEIHPEDPRRIHEIFQEIQQAGLVQGADDEDEEDSAEEQCWRIHTRSATKAEICLVHTPEHYDFIDSLQEMIEEQLVEEANALDSIYLHNSTFECAVLAAGGAIEACKAVVRGDVRNAIAIIRPPGHHAEHDKPSGFCIFNNVPIATKVCQNDLPELCRKVLILDWDVHHGNGIQHAFYDDPNVLYMSLHVYANQAFYPSLPDGNSDYVGEGPGIGKNVNVPWADTGMGDAEYIYAFQEVIMPIAAEFDPDLVIISAGFDAAEGDMLGGCHVSPACYAHMTHMLMRIAGGKVAVCLEGGYNLRSIARSALAVTRTLMLQPPDRLAEDLGPPKPSAVEVVQEVKRAHSKYWKCLFPKHLDQDDPSFLATSRLHDIVREWQSRTLAEEHRMTPLVINKSGIGPSFEHNIIATPDFMGRHPLLVIFHDPPEIMNIADPSTGKTELHNTWLTDVTKTYIDWAVENDFQVIDVNIPMAVAIDDDDGGYIKADDKEVRASQTKELAGYLWENYIEPNDATQVFLMGIGAAYVGLVDLLSRFDATTESDSIVECLIGFVADCAINSIKKPTDDHIGTWYYAHSLIFVQDTHLVWDPTRNRKVRKKYGNLQKSSKNKVNEMLIEHKEEVLGLLLRKKNEYERIEEEDTPMVNSKQYGLRSPPLPGASTPITRHGSTPTSLKSPKMPPVGMFNVSGNPKSPLRRTFA
ncbi:putative histone deacetylase [Pleomassaria siparia CBS 279.74]|uniref:Histone deacetylase n=1 Tax=Pleomassaria siparia CBS 279.74 TaxID=1314801 RepID=A0A6G1KEV4_9PLEO|nr:putative histone deacetylase [Pleomassaria siparia CBS 279.74]